MKPNSSGTSPVVGFFFGCCCSTNTTVSADAAAAAAAAYVTEKIVCFALTFFSRRNL